MSSLSQLVLIPTPRSVSDMSDVYTLDVSGRIGLAGGPGLLSIGQQVQADLADHHCSWSITAAPVACGICLALDAELGHEAYTLEIRDEGVIIAGGDAAGVFYGAMTLRQILRQCGCTLPCGVIEDSPDMKQRGIMLDISRDKVPTMQTLFQIVDMMAELKLNRLELYTEHTFAYSMYPEVWIQASPMTGEQIMQLDAYCQQRYVELVPNQNSFGHMHRWLKMPRLNHLAECPDGFDWPWGGHHDEPFTLDPGNPGSIELIAQMYDELLPHFTSRNFNVGCDETFDLGLGASKERCAQLGSGRVYLDFLLQIYSLCAQRGRRMHFWGDIVIQHPELVPELPKDVVVLEWGYEAAHPFADRLPKYAESGLDFMVCPGTSTWGTITGRVDNALANIQSAAENGLRYGAAGLLNTDWGDCGHLQYLPFSYPGFAAGAAWSWCVESARSLDLSAALNRHLFRDPSGTVADAVMDLGRAYLHAGTQVPNSSVLFRLLVNPAADALPEGVTPDTLRSTVEFVDAAAARAATAAMHIPDAALVRDEVANGARMLRHACRRGMALYGGVPSSEVRGKLLEELVWVLGEHRRLWMARNREGGLQDSAARLQERLSDYTGR